MHKNNKREKDLVICHDLFNSSKSDKYFDILLLHTMYIYFKIKEVLTAMTDEKV